MDDEGHVGDIHAGPTNGPATDPNLAGAKPSHSRVSRKRTKTGCLTCRRRRIKCGEERPTCGNCIKSKRQCEGYNQRVIFKDPLSIIRGPVLGTSAQPPFQSESVPGFPTAPPYNHFRHVQNPSQPKSLGSVTEVEASHQNHGPESATLPGVPGQVSHNIQLQPYDDLPKNGAGLATRSGGLRKANCPEDARPETEASSYISNDQEVPDKSLSGRAVVHYDFNNIFTNESKPKIQQGSHADLSDRPTGLNRASEPQVQELIYHSNIREAASALLTQSYQGATNWNLNHGQHIPPHQNLVTEQQPETRPANANDHPYSMLHSGLKTQSLKQSLQQKEDSDGRVLRHDNQTTALRDSSWQDQIEYFPPERQDFTAKALKNDVPIDAASGGMDLEEQYADHEMFDKSDYEDSPEGYDHDPNVEFGKVQHDHLRNNDLGIVVALQASQDRQGQSLRTYRSFLDGPNMLATYQPSARNSPLSDGTTARIFCHYINVTGPSISLYERHPANPSLMFQGRPVPSSHQHIWAYTMPTLALSDQALLQAMLAIGSLHVALLQDGPITPSLKHYHMAIRQVAKSVRLPVRRAQPATLAATLLLGWYELMSADHQKWSSHLLGARQLLKEIDFAGMTTYLKNRKLHLRQARYNNLYHHEMALGIIESHYDDSADGDGSLPNNDDINENLVGMIMGKKLRYDQYGQVLDDVKSPKDPHRCYTQRELETYETQRDLFWWYCKQDAFQSILSSNRLFMQYDLWSHCPPRAAIGKRDATFGTYDHLILLLGRLAEFAAKDLKRKRKAIHRNGGHWQPPPGAPAQPSSAGQHGVEKSRNPEIPSFAGMMPGTEGKATLPRGFSPTREESPISEDDDRSIEDWTVDAEEEWFEIRTAFNILEENFGPDFQPLGPEYSKPVETPFGPALQYRTYSIAGIWITYYMGLILCHRCHPSMPPAAMIAAGMAARQTAYYANEIGRISAAIAPNASQLAQVSTGVGAGLIECTFGLFIAGVQFRDSAQRSWLVQRCLDIKRLTGWQTAEAIAMGCESSWVKTAEAGKGPPYNRVTEKKIDQNIWYSARRRIDHVLSERQDRDKLLVARTDRVHYALGLLGVEEDFENLNFENDGKDVAA